MLNESISADTEYLIKSGINFLGILNDLKRRPEDAANELQVSIDEINLIIQGKIKIRSEIIDKALNIWPVNAFVDATPISGPANVGKI